MNFVKSKTKKTKNSGVCVCVCVWGGGGGGVNKAMGRVELIQALTLTSYMSAIWDLQSLQSFLTLSTGGGWGGGGVGGGEAKEKRESCMTVTVTSVWTVDTITSFAWLLSFSSVWPGPSQCNCHLLISPSGEVLLMTVLWVKHMQECLTCCLMVLFIGMLVQFCMMFCSHTHSYVCTKRLKLLFFKAQFTDWVINDIDVCVLLCRTFIQTYIW